MWLSSLVVMIIAFAYSLNFSLIAGQYRDSNVGQKVIDKVDRCSGLIWTSMLLIYNRPQVKSLENTGEIFGSILEGRGGPMVFVYYRQSDPSTLCQSLLVIATISVNLVCIRNLWKPLIKKHTHKCPFSFD